MYALPGNVVVRRRKPLLVPVIVLAVGVALIVLNNLLGESLSVNFRSAIVFVGGGITIVGGALVLARLLASGGVPFHSASKCYLAYDELYFDRKALGEVTRSVGEGSVQRLLAMERSEVPAVAVALYRTRDNQFAAMQAYEYSDLEYKPLTELRIVGR